MFRPVHARTLSIYYLFRVASRQGSYDINIIYTCTCIILYIQCFIRDRGETRIIYNAHIKQGRRRVPPVFFLPSNLNYRATAGAAEMTVVVVVVFFVISLSSYFLFHLFFHFPLDPPPSPKSPLLLFLLFPVVHV